MALKLIYMANILLAGWVGISSLFFPKMAVQQVFNHAFSYSEAIRLVGALWCAVLIISILGLAYPEEMSLILVFQLVYKGLWLVVVALLAIFQSTSYPKGMAGFFLIWVIILPFVIPWESLFPAKG